MTDEYLPWERRLTTVEVRLSDAIKDIERLEVELKSLRDFAHKARVDLHELMNDKHERERITEDKRRG